MLAQKTGYGLRQLLIRFHQGRIVFPQQQHHAAHQIPLAENGGGSAKVVFVCPVGSPDGGIAELEEVIAALLHQFFQFGCVGDESVANADTIRLDISQLPEGKVNEETEPIDDSREQPAEEKEAFTEQWEPEYEQPMGEYVPPQPIIFRPKSRLRELKRKLVNGPERRYYELIEQGCIRLQFAILVSLLVAVLSIGTTVVYELGMLVGRLKLVTFLQLFCMLIAALMGTYQLMDGVADMVTLLQVEAVFTDGTRLVSIHRPIK